MALLSRVALAAVGSYLRLMSATPRRALVLARVGAGGSLARGLFLAAVLVSAFSTAGCAPFFHKPRPDLDLSVEQRPWRVRCGYWLAAIGPAAQSPRPRDEGSVWARDTSGRRLVVSGVVEDGFFVVSALRAASDRDDRDVRDLPATADEVRNGCDIAVDGQVQGEQPRIHTIAATRDGEGIDVPLVFPDDPALPRPVSRVVVFGDSLSDTGNLKERLAVFPNSPYWLGRFSNGPNWTEYFSENSGIAVQNEAFGGAVAVRHEDVPAAGIVAAIEQGAQFFLTGSIDRQVGDYLTGDLQGAGLRHPGETAFVLWGGANDYISKEPFSGAISTLLDDPNGEAGYVRLVDETVQALVGMVRRLHDAGGRQFVVLNLPDLGRTPIPLQNRSYASRGSPDKEIARRIELSRKLGELSAYHNRRLARSLGDLERQLPDLTVVVVDSARVMDRISRRVSLDGSGRPFDYGFSNSGLETTLAFGNQRVRLPERCYEGGYLGSLSDQPVCSRWPNSMFWDVVHPSSYLHCWIAYVVQHEMARRGLSEPPLSVEDQRAYCTVRTQPAY